MTIDTMIFTVSLATLVGILVGAALGYRRRVRLLKHQVAVMAAELAELREAHAAAVRGVQVAVAENARLRTRRPLLLNGKLYCSYRILPEWIHPN